MIGIKILWALALGATLSCSELPEPVVPEIPDEEQNGNPAQNNGGSDEPGHETPTSKTLIVYYSFTGNCKAVATTLAGYVKADVLEIKPAEEGLDYAANNYAIGSSLIAAIRENPNDAASYPGIKPTSREADDQNN